MPDKRREIRIKCPASHSFLSCSSFIPLSLDSRKDMFTELSHGQAPTLQTRMHIYPWENGSVATTPSGRLLRQPSSREIACTCRPVQGELLLPSECPAFHHDWPLVLVLDPRTRTLFSVCESTQIA